MTTDFLVYDTVNLVWTSLYSMLIITPAVLLYFYYSDVTELEFYDDRTKSYIPLVWFLWFSAILRMFMINKLISWVSKDELKKILEQKKTDWSSHAQGVKPEAE